MRIILFRSYENLKLYVILCIFCVLMIFYIYQIIHSFPNKFKSLSSKFPIFFFYNNEDKAVSRFFFDAYFDRYCVNVALNNSTHSILIIRESIAVIKFMKEMLLNKKRRWYSLCYNSMVLPRFLANFIVVCNI